MQNYPPQSMKRPQSDKIVGKKHRISIYRMGAYHVIFGIILALCLLQIIRAQLLTMQNIPLWRSVVSVFDEIYLFIFKKNFYNL